MMRRRRPHREIPFSFDSFLDVVANVVGIIIRLILVVWVGARSYSSLVHVQAPTAARPSGPKKPSTITDPLQNDLAQHRQELAALQARLLEQLRLLGQRRTEHQATQAEWVSSEEAAQAQEQLQTELQTAVRKQQAAGHTVALSLGELRQECDRLRKQIHELEKLPRVRRTLHYHTPVSAPVDSEELMFECRHGRVTFIDVATLLAEVRRDLEDKGKQLTSRWEVEGVAGPVGAFRLQYSVQRQRGLFDALGGDAPPASGGAYRYGLNEWHLEPVTSARGETETAALAEASDFRQVVDLVDPKQTVVTMWVYPDSFALYRRLRDYLYDRDIVVAGRPLPEGMSISCSRQGSRSRGQ
jgi:hypothetical protein